MAARPLVKQLADRIRALRRRQGPFARLVADLPSSWAGPGYTSDADMIFIGGCPSSGTTVLRELLGRHPRLAVGPEGGFFHQPPIIERLAVQWEVEPGAIASILRASPSRPAFVEAMASIQMQRSGKSRYVEKTPINCRFVSQILQSFPNGRFIHIVRDGRDVACSLRTYGGAKLRGGRMVGVASHNRIADVAQFWAHEVSHGLASRGHPRCLEVRYERLVAEPASEISRICAFIGEEFQPGLLDTAPSLIAPLGVGRFVASLKATEPVDPTRAGRWVRDLDPGEKRDVAFVAGALLAALGYVNDNRWADE